MPTAVSDFVHNDLLPAVKKTGGHIQGGVAYVYNKVIWLDKTVENFTHKLLPRPAAVILCVFLRALPFLIMYHTLPVLAFGGVLVGLCVFKAIATNNRKNLSSLPQGSIVAVASSILFQSAKTLVQHMSVPVAFGMGSMLFGTLLLASTGVINDVFGIPQPEPKNAASNTTQEEQVEQTNAKPPQTPDAPSEEQVEQPSEEGA